MVLQVTVAHCHSCTFWPLGGGISVSHLPPLTATAAGMVLIILGFGV